MPKLNPRFVLFVLLFAAISTSAQTLPATDSTLEPIMAAEFALQAGRLPEAADGYLKAAEGNPDNYTLVSRASWLALLANKEENAKKALSLWKKQQPNSIERRSTQAVYWLRQNDESEAWKEIALIAKSDDPDTWKHIIFSFTQGSRDPEVTARLLKKLINKAAVPDDLNTWRELIQLAKRTEDKTLMGAMFQQVLKRFPNEPRVALLRAGQFQQEGQMQKSRDILEKLAQSPNIDDELSFGIAYGFEALKAYQAAEQVLAKAAQTPTIYGLRAQLLSKMEDTAPLENLYQQIQQPITAPDSLSFEELEKQSIELDNAQRRLLLGKIAEFLKRPEEAIRWYSSVPSNIAEARLRTANMQYFEGDKTKAFQILRELQADARIETADRVGSYLLEAELHQKDNNLAAEQETLARGLSTYPNENVLLYARALMWERSNHIDKSEADLRKILVTEPENAAALNALGYTLADRTDRFQEALELIARAHAAEPDNPAIIDSYGWVLYQLGRYKEAILELRHAWSLAKDPEIAAHLAEVLWVSGNREEAKQFIEASRQLDPESRALQRALEKMSL